VLVFDSSNVIQFIDSLDGGVVSKDGKSYTILAGLTPGASSVVSGGLTATYTFGSVDRDGFQRLSSGTATVSFVSTPEPGALGMVGTGLIGLVGMARRKLKLWT